VPRGRQTFAETVLAKSGADEWFSEYTRKGYFRVDPVIREVRRNGRPFLWSEIVVNQEKSPDGAAVMNKRHTYGFNDGLVVPIHSPGNRTNLVSMSGTHLNLTPLARQLLPLVAIRAFERIQDINLVGPQKSSLTARECEILSYVARGESAARIGVALSIAENTVETHVRHACLKLGAFNRAHAVAIAITDNLIQI
jgi:DNA-binding CsgD family transcriptional regulator